MGIVFIWWAVADLLLIVRFDSFMYLFEVHEHLKVINWFFFILSFYKCIISLLWSKQLMFSHYNAKEFNLKKKRLFWCFSFIIVYSLVFIWIIINKYKKLSNESCMILSSLMNSSFYFISNNFFSIIKWSYEFVPKVWYRERKYTVDLIIKI